MAEPEDVCDRSGDTDHDRAGAADAIGPPLPGAARGGREAESAVTSATALEGHATDPGKHDPHDEQDQSGDRVTAHRGARLMVSALTATPMTKSPKNRVTAG